MANFQNIYTGPARLALYDSTNKLVDLGENNGIMIMVEPKTETFNRHVLTLAHLLTIETEIVDTSAEMAAALELARRASDLSLNILTPEKYFVLSPAILRHGISRPMDEAETHLRKLEFNGVEKHLSGFENLLAINGAFNDYTQWTAPTGADVNAGPTNAIRFVFDDSGQVVYTEIAVRGVGPLRLKISGSEAISSWSTGFCVSPVLFYDGVEVLRPTPPIISSEANSFSLTFDIPSISFDTIRLEVWSPIGTHQPVIQNLQMELGEATPFKEV
jgi:hypothetical protein